MIGSSENRISYNGNGIATEFAYNFIIIEKSDIKVLHVAADGTEQLLTKDYYVDMEKSIVLYPGYAPGAEIPEQNRPPILPVGERLVLYREVPITQESALDKHWPFNVIENGLDKLTIICQQIWDRLQRSFYVSESTSSNFDPKVPIEAGKTFRVKDDGTGFEVTEDPGKVIDGATALLKQTTEQANIAVENAANAQNAANAAEAVAPEYAKTKEVLDNIVSYTNAATEQASIATAMANTATSKADAANTSATNAAQSYANADAIATQLTEYLATKETLTAPAVDKTLLIEGAAADSKVVGQSLESIRSGDTIDDKSISVLHLQDVELGENYDYYVNKTEYEGMADFGEGLVESSTLSCSDFVRVQPSKRYFFSYGNTGNLDVQRITFFDKDKKFIKTNYVGQAGGSLIITTATNLSGDQIKTRYIDNPENSYFIKFHTPTSMNYDYSQIKIQENSSIYAKSIPSFSTLSCKEDAQEIEKIKNGALYMDSISLEHNNWLEWDETRDYFYDKTYNANTENTDGAFLSSDLNSCSNMIKINPGTYYISKLDNSRTYITRVTFFDKNKRAIVSSYADSSNGLLTNVSVNGNSCQKMIVPDNVAFIVVNVRTNDVPNFDDVKIQKDIIATINKPYTDKINVVSSNDIPSYWTEHLNNSISSIRKNILDGNESVTFAFITDSHTQRGNDSNGTYIQPIAAGNGGKLLKYLSERLPLSCVLHGGDLINWYDTTEYGYEALCKAVDEYKDVRDLMFHTIGNHDVIVNIFNYGDDVVHNGFLTQKEIWAALISRNRKGVVYGSKPWASGSEHYGGGDSGALYGYFDDEQSRIRYISLNCYDCNEATNSPGNRFTNTEINWVANILLDLYRKSDFEKWDVVFFCHQAYKLEDGTELVVNTDILLNVLDAAKNGTNYTLHNYSNGGTTINIDVTFDKPIDIVGIFCGHLHQDLHQTTDGGVNIIVTNSDCCSNHSGKLGSVTEQLFDIVTINKLERSIKMKRIGYGEDREFSY